MWRVQTHYHTAQAKRLGAPPCALHAARDFPGPAIALGEKAGKVLQNLSVLETFGALKGFQDCGSGVIVDLGLFHGQSKLFHGSLVSGPATMVSNLRPVISDWTRMTGKCVEEPTK